MQSVRRAIVTGGSSGIGRGIAEALARDGCQVGILHVDAPEDGERVAESLERISGVARRGWSRVCNVADAPDVAAAFHEFLARFGGLEVLVNAAGVFRDSVVWKMSDAQWREVLEVNLSGAFHCARAAAGRFARRGAGQL